MHPTTWDNPTGEVSAAAMILQRVIPIRGFSARLSVLYVPRGPLLNWEDLDTTSLVLDSLKTFARKKGGIFIKVDPEVIIGKGVPGEEGAQDVMGGSQVLKLLKQKGWRYSEEQIQFKNTFWLDTTLAEDELLENMKQKTRYNIRLSARRGVTVRRGTEADFNLLYRMYAETSVRDGFTIREKNYYLDVWRAFLHQGMVMPLIAEFEQEPIAGLFLFHFGKTAWYLHGMSSAFHREKMPNYLLQWEAVREAKKLGCSRYDMWGAPDLFDERDSMWGVFKFKQGFNAQVIRTIGAWDLPVRPQLYTLYTRILPRLLAVARRWGDANTRQQLD